MTKRWIMHVDMDAFFASVEQHDHPEYAGKPLIVGGMTRRGVVSTCSYEARKFGVHSAMPTEQARQLCPAGIFIPGRMHRYREVSAQINEIFHAFSPLVEPLSIDEAFLDVSGMERLMGDIPDLGRKIKQAIKDRTGLTASVGLAPNKFLAKLASDLEKPDGLVIITEEEAAAFIAPLPVGKIFGIGKQSEERLRRMGITTIGQLAHCPVEYLYGPLGNNAPIVRDLALGIDDRPVVSEHEAKSIGKETTFENDLSNLDDILAQLLELSQEVGWRVRKAGFAGHTVTLKVKYKSFRLITRSETSETPVNMDEDIYRIIKRLALGVSLAEPVRLLGVSLSKPDSGQGIALPFAEDEKKQRRNAAVDALKNKFGEKIINRGKINN